MKKIIYIVLSVCIVLATLVAFVFYSQFFGGKQTDDATEVLANGACTIGSAVIQDTAKQTFFDTAVVPVGLSCTTHEQIRECNGGVATGDAAYIYTSCEVAKPVGSSYKGVSYAPDLSGTKSADLTYGGRIDLADPSFATVHLRYVWGQINPSKGVYDFSVLDTALDQVAAAGKKATIVISAGKWTPEWVFVNGAQHFSVPIAASKVNKDSYAQEYIPLVWDQVYLREYDNMVKALASHLRTSATRYNAVVLVKISGINVASAEMRLTQEKVFTQGDDELCPFWAKDGYSESKVLSAANTLAKSISDAFPDKQLGLAFVTGAGRFPAVSNGQCDTKNMTNTLDLIIQSLQTTYGKRLVTNSTVLAWDTGNPKLFEEFEANGTPFAFQFNSQALGCKDLNPDTDTPATTGPLTDDDVCTKPEFQATIDRAIKYKSAFIEVFPNNIVYFSDILRTANKTLQSL